MRKRISREFKIKTLKAFGVYEDGKQVWSFKGQYGKIKHYVRDLKLCGVLRVVVDSEDRRHRYYQFVSEVKRTLNKPKRKRVKVTYYHNPKFAFGYNQWVMYRRSNKC